MTDVGEAAIHDTRGEKAGEREVSLSQTVQRQSEKDAMTPAPEKALQRMVDVTRDGIQKIPEAFIHSLDPHNILPNVAIGFAMGAVTIFRHPWKFIDNHQGG